MVNLTGFQIGWDFRRTPVSTFPASSLQKQCDLPLVTPYNDGLDPLNQNEPSFPYVPSVMHLATEMGHVMNSGSAY